MEEEVLVSRPVPWFAVAVFRVAGLHAAVLATVQLVQSGHERSLVENIGAMAGLAVMAAIFSGVLFAVLGGLTHLLLGALKARSWWSYLLVGLLIGASLGEFIASIGMFVPNATGPNPYSAATHRWIVVVFTGWSALNAMIGWWSWRQEGERRESAPGP